MIVAIELKKREAGPCIFSIVIHKFCYGQKHRPIVLSSMDESMQISFHCIILPLDLAVRLWIKCSEKFLLNAEKVV